MADSTVQESTSRDTQRWEALKRPTPDWFRDAKLGVFIHWGPYSVPAWAEPLGELGTIPPLEWFKHNPYSEWYYNTIRIPGSPAGKHHQEQWGGRPYDDFLDMWQAEAFDPAAVAEEIVAAGADYLVLTTKHHDGVCLWDAPGTGDRNTVKRGPKRDLVQAYADACREQGLRFGTYYSGGLDWHVSPQDPIGLRDDMEITERPLDAAYASYAASHIRDLVDRYSPDVVWNDIDWPDAGKDFGKDGVGTLFEEYYASTPEGVVNDRWQVPHFDFATSEYQNSLDNENEDVWENCRGVGLSFAYNSVEGRQHALSGPEAAKHLVDVVSRGGRLLLGVGPQADGTLPKWQSQILRDLGEWMKGGAEILKGLRPTKRIAEVSASWVRFGVRDGKLLAFVDSDEPVTLPGAEVLTPQWASVRDGQLHLDPQRPGPVVVQLPA